MDISKYCIANELEALNIKSVYVARRVFKLHQKIDWTADVDQNVPRSVGEGLYACGPTQMKWIKCNNLVEVGTVRGITIASSRQYYDVIYKRK